MSCDAGAANRGSNPVSSAWHTLRQVTLNGKLFTLGALITVAAKPRRGRHRRDHPTITIDSYTTSIFFLVVEEVLACPDELRRRSSESGFESSPLGLACLRQVTLNGKLFTLGALITIAAKPRRGRPRLDHQTITIDSYTTSIFFLVVEE